MSVKSSKYALVIGVDYRGSPCQLDGCEVDALRMQSYFNSLGYSVILMTETNGKQKGFESFRPTRKNILSKIEYISKQKNLTDVAITFAGHGTQLLTTEKGSGSEKDGKDECLVCQSEAGASTCPSRGDLIVDNDLLALLKRCYSALPINLFLMFDACHSGTICDLGFGLTKTWVSVPKGYVKSSGDQWKVICFSAADDSECALEAGSGGGLMTSKFFQRVERGGKTIADFLGEFATMSFQTPQISSAEELDVNMVIFSK